MLALISSLPVAASAAGAEPARLGKVQFKVECSEAAQREFNLAMAYYHSFAWSYLKDPLERTLKADPSCGMAHWARVLGSLDNPFGWPGNVSAATLAAGSDGLEAARTAGLKTQRERDYVDALAVFFKDHDKLNHRTRAKALELALEGVAKRYPDDTEAAILYALVLSANFDPADKQYTNQLHAAAILEPLFKAQPEHPGVAHYLIHSYDYPPLAGKGLDAAKRYDKIAPDAAHAQHMPSHIFTRVGAWRESIASNSASSRTDAGKSFNTLHAYDYMVYAHLQLGQDAAARKVMADMVALPNKIDSFAAAYAYAAIPARLAIERGAWQEAAGLNVAPTPADYPWTKYPHAEAINAFARGLGAAAAKNAAAAQAEVTRLQQLREATAALKLGYWVEQIDIQSEVVSGFAAFGDGRRDEGIERLRKAAAREDATEKHVVTPGPILPAREVLASVLLEQGRAAEALREFEAVLQKEPNRLRATAGAAAAAERSGDTQKARQYHGRVLDLTDVADSPRPEVADAKRFLRRG
jgi:tetratricopeptide (TPR) repeat protein